MDIGHFHFTGIPKDIPIDTGEAKPDSCEGKPLGGKGTAGNFKPGKIWSMPEETMKGLEKSYSFFRENTLPRN